MKDFFSHYGWIIVAGALITLTLMYTNPMTEAVGTQEMTMGDLLADKTMEMAGLKETTPIIDGTNIILSNDADGNGVVSKGDTLTFDKTYLYENAASTSPDQFLVLKTDGYDVELLAKANYQNSKFNISSVPTTDNKGQFAQKYDGSTFDTLLNTTYYNSLSDTVKGMIKSKEITQYSWEWNGDTTEASSWYKSEFTEADTSGTVYRLSNTGTVGTYERNVYALDVQDVVEYLGTTFTPQQLNTMFFEINANVSRFAWLRSASYGSKSGAFYVAGRSGYLIDGFYNSPAEVHPAFTITLN